MTFKSQELRALRRLTLPILATQLAQIGMGTIDTVMSGYVSTHDLAAVAIGASIWMPLWLFMAGILVALSPLTARLNAAGKEHRLPRLLGAALVIGGMAGIVFGCLLGLLANYLPAILDDPLTARIAKDYLLAIAFGMPGAGIFLAYRFHAEALDQAAHVTRVMLSGLALNVPANAVFVYGWLGMPEMGGAGCGAGSSLIFALMAIMMFISTKKHRLPKHYPLWQHTLKPDWLQVRQIIALGLPIGIAIFFEVSLFSVIALFLLDLGPAVVGGHQVALNVASLIFMIPLSVGMALTVRVGHHLGSDQAELAQRSSWLGMQVNLAMALFNATLIVLLAKPISTLYSPDPQVVAIGIQLLWLAAVFQISDAIQIAAAGALRGYQDTFMVMVITFSSYWLVGLTSGYWLAFYYEKPLGATGFWIGLIAGLSCAAVALSYRLWQVSQQHIHLQPSDKKIPG